MHSGKRLAAALTDVRGAVDSERYRLYHGLLGYLLSVPRLRGTTFPLLYFTLSSKPQPRFQKKSLAPRFASVSRLIIG